MHMPLYYRRSNVLCPPRLAGTDLGILRRLQFVVSIYVDHFVYTLFELGVHVGSIRRPLPSICLRAFIAFALPLNRGDDDQPLASLERETHILDPLDRLVDSLRRIPGIVHIHQSQVIYQHHVERLVAIRKLDHLLHLSPSTYGRLTDEYTALGIAHKIGNGYVPQKVF